jgi:hypothetical protein
MPQRDDILQELKELQSSLTGSLSGTVYSVPAGYFDSLVMQVLTRIKALEASNAKEELEHLSSSLSTVSRQTPYTVPDGYFETLPLIMLGRVSKTAEPLSAKEELESLSPLLGSLKKQMPYSVPAGYFDSLQKAPLEKPAAKVISLTHRTWFRVAAAAVITGVVVLSGFFFLNRKTTVESGQSLAQFTLDVKKLDEPQKDTLIEYIDGGLYPDYAVNTSGKAPDVKELLKGVSDAELNDLQQQTEDIQDVMMTN